MSKGSSRRRLPAFWNPARGVWETSETNLFCEHSELFSATWPASGSMRSGVASERTRSAPPTAAAASSSTPGRLMPTPRTSDTNGAGTHGDGGMDLRTAVSLLPTPAARDWKSGESNLMDRNSRPLNEVVVNLLPTPTASNPNDGESLESWEARRQRNLEKGINGNGQGTPLAIAVRQLSNPPALPADAASGCTTPEDSAPAATDALIPTSDGPMKLLPTPAASFPGTTANFRPDGTPYGDGYGMTLLDAVRLLPTPRATDGTKGGPNQRGSKGDLMLPSAAAQLLPTPTTSDGERTSSSYGRGNPTLTGAITNPPSDVGSESSDDPHLGQLTLLDD